MDWLRDDANHADLRGSVRRCVGLRARLLSGESSQVVFAIRSLSFALALPSSRAPEHRRIGLDSNAEVQVDHRLQRLGSEDLGEVLTDEGLPARLKLVDLGSARCQLGKPTACP